MTQDASRLLAEALRLPPADRADLAAELIESLDDTADDDADAAWDAQIQDRIAQLDAGAVKTIPWAQVRRRIMGAIKRDPAD